MGKWTNNICFWKKFNPRGWFAPHREAIYMSADLTKGVFGRSSTFYATNFKNHPNLKNFECSVIYVKLLYYCNTTQDTNISFEAKLFVSCMLPWQPLCHKDYPHSKNWVSPLLAHLSRRLIGELIVYPCSGVRPASVRCPSSTIFKDLLP